jgi:hypothetical protein
MTEDYGIKKQAELPPTPFSIIHPTQHTPYARQAIPQNAIKPQFPSRKVEKCIVLMRTQGTALEDQPIMYKSWPFAANERPRMNIK